MIPGQPDAKYALVAAHLAWWRRRTAPAGPVRLLDHERRRDDALDDHFTRTYLPLVRQQKQLRLPL
jgi:hypothetical protein